MRRGVKSVRQGRRGVSSMFHSKLESQVINLLEFYQYAFQPNSEGKKVHRSKTNTRNERGQICITL